MKKIITLVFVTIVAGCASTIMESPVVVHLQPLHGVATGLGEFKYTQAQLLDNDGNLYLTYWNAGNNSEDEFTTNIKFCKKEILSDRIFGKAKTITQIQESQIVPSLYVPFIKCINNFGYRLENKEAVLPKKYRLSLSRGHSSHKRYMPVGGMFYLSKNGSNYLAAYVAVTACKESASSEGNGGVDETFSGGYSSVSIVGYLDTMKECLEEMSFSVVPVSKAST